MSVRWHKSLTGKNDALFNSPVDFNNDLLIAWECSIGDEGESYYRFAAFPNYLEFWEFFQNQPKSKRCFHEITPVYRFQKMRFDIDIDGSDDLEAGEIIIEELVSACLKIFQKYNIRLNLRKDFLICSSHSLDHRNPKLSYHVILPRYRLANCYMAHQLYVEIAAEMPDEASRFLDKGIYNANHMLRTLYSYKFGKPRIKEVDLSFTYQDQKVEILPRETELEWFCDSLVTWAFEAKKMHVPIPVPEIMPSIEVTSKTIDAAIRLLKSLDKEGLWEADIERISGPIVPLTRQKDADGVKKINMCWVCTEEKSDGTIGPKQHESSDAYLLVFDENVRFYCYRGGKENISLGQVKF
jgi:hypothetical protein